VAEARKFAARVVGEASCALLKESHEDAKQQVNDLAKVMNEFEARLVKGECRANGTANTLLKKHEQLTDRYNSVSQAIEQCRLQTRANHKDVPEMMGKLELYEQAVQSQDIAMKAEQVCQRRDRDQQLQSLHQNLDGTLKAALADIEVKMYDRVDREAAARGAGIVQALDDIGTVLEQEIPSKMRSEVSKMKPMSATAPASSDTRFMLQTALGGGGSFALPVYQSMQSPPYPGVGTLSLPVYPAMQSQVVQATMPSICHSPPQAFRSVTNPTAPVRNLTRSNTNPTALRNAPRQSSPGPSAIRPPSRMTSMSKSIGWMSPRTGR